MKNLVFYWTIAMVFAYGCQESSDSSTAEDSSIAEPVAVLPEMSIYHLPGVWTDQDNHNFELKELRGKVVVMVMIYTSCQAACPRLIADMRRIKDQIPARYGDDVQYVLVSIDPETDTPERLKNFAAENEMTDDRWMFIRSTKEITREFASVLAVNYKKISPMDFSHSNIISVFDRDGQMVFQQEGLDLAHEKTVRTIVQLAADFDNQRG